jgi:hypothetical protein
MLATLRKRRSYLGRKMNAGAARDDLVREYHAMCWLLEQHEGRADTTDRKREIASVILERAARRVQ